MKMVRRWHQPDDLLEQRAALKARIEAVTEDGMIAVCRSGRDCDGVSYISATHIPAPGLMAFVKSEADHDRWLDGPESTWLAKPSDAPDGYEQLSSGWER